MPSLDELLLELARRVGRLRENAPRILLGFAFVALVLAVALGWFFRPWLQPIIYTLYTQPVLLLALALGLLVGGFVWQRLPQAGPQTVLVVAFIVAIIGTGATGLLAGQELGQATMATTEETASLSETDATKPRIVPKSVASRYASNTLNFPQYRIAGGDVTIRNGTPYWSYALAPDGAYNHFTKRQHGTVLVDMTEQNAEVSTVVGDLEKGVGPAFYNNYRFSLLKKGEYLVDYGDPFMVVHEDEQYIAVPYTTPTFHWLPLPYTTPEWGGVALISNDGTVEDLTPAEARDHEALSEQKLYPFDLARTKVAATKYRNGILNTFTSHEDEIEVAPVPGEDNDQPFLVFTEQGPEYVVAVEPYGEAQGLKEIWTVDGRTGEYERFTPNGSLFGARKATDYVRQAARTTDWNRFTPAEPIPVVVDGELYWEVRVVPDDSSGIAYVAFVNARSSDVQEVSTSDEVTAFLEGESMPDDGGEPSDREPSFIVQRVAPNGTVIETLEIYGDESVRVVQGNATNTTNTSG